MISKEVIKKHLEEIEYKAIACETNINNVKSMLEQIEAELKKANKDQIKDLTVAKDMQTENLIQNEKALKMHEANIIFLRNKLWI